MNFSLSFKLRILAILLVLSTSSCTRYTQSNQEVIVNKTQNKKLNKTHLDKQIALTIFPTNETLSNIPENIDPYFIINNIKEIKKIENFFTTRFNKKNDGRYCIVKNETYKSIKECALKIKNDLKNEDLNISHVISSSTGDHKVYLSSKIRDLIGVKTGMNSKMASIYYDKNIMKQFIQNRNQKKLVNIIPDTKFTVDFIKSQSGSKEEILAIITDKIHPLLRNSNINDELVLKPTNDAGSKGINFLNNDEELVENIYTIVFNQNKANITPYILEKKIEGNILRVDGYVDLKGEIKAAYVSKYGIPPKEFYQLSKSQLTFNIPKNSTDYQKYKNATINILNTLGYKNGVYHLELIESSTDGKIYFLEIAARIGGTLGETFNEIGMNLEKAIVYSCLNRELDVTDIIDNNKTFASLAIVRPRNINYVEWYLDEIHRPNPKDLNFLFADEIINPGAKENISWTYLEKTYHKKDDNRIIQAIFIADIDQYEQMLEEANNYSNNISISIKILDGQNQNEWYSFQNGEWRKL